MVEVRMMKRVDDGTYYLEVLVSSQTRVRPQLKNKGIVELKDANEQVVGVLAGALAEQLCDRYNDTVEPSQAAKDAMEAYRELMAENPVVRLGDDEAREYDRAISAGLAKH